jgi:hypothetical protein
MTDQAPCPRCRQENPPRNRFCGSCGAPLTSGEQLATREENHPVPAGRAWPTKFGPVGKALAVGVAALATEAGLSWLRRRIGAEDRSSGPAVRGLGSATRGYLVRQSLEEVLQMWGGFPRPVRRAARGPIVLHHGAERLAKVTHLLPTPRSADRPDRAQGGGSKAPGQA